MEQLPQLKAAMEYRDLINRAAWLMRIRIANTKRKHRAQRYTARVRL